MTNLKKYRIDRLVQVAQLQWMQRRMGVVILAIQTFWSFGHFGVHFGSSDLQSELRVKTYCLQTLIINIKKFPAVKVEKVAGRKDPQDNLLAETIKQKMSAEKDQKLAPSPSRICYPPHPAFVMKYP